MGEGSRADGTTGGRPIPSGGALPRGRTRRSAGGSAAVLASLGRDSAAGRDGSSDVHLFTRYLREHLTDPFVLLNHRRAPRSRHAIDHVVVAPSGVWLIDAVRWEDGTIEFTGDGRMSVYKMRLRSPDGVRPKVTEDIYRQVGPVARIVGDPTVTVQPALIFVGTEGSGRSALRFMANEPFEHQRVLIAAPKAIVRRIQDPGPLDAGSVAEIGARLDAALGHTSTVG